MYKIERTDYGFKIMISGKIDDDEIKEWILDSKKLLIDAPKEFSVFVDLRNLEPLLLSTQEYIQEGQLLYKNRGSVRSVIVLDNIITKLQFQKIAKKTGIYQWERYLSSSDLLNPEEVGLNWIKHGIDPDK